MKFTIVAVILGLALATEASWIPDVHHGHPEVSVWGNGLWDHHKSYDGAWHGDDGAWHGDHGAWDDGQHDGAWHGDHGAWDDGHHDGAWHGDHGAWDDGHHDGAWASHGPVNTHGISLNQGSGWDSHHYAAPAHHAYAPAHHDNHHHDAVHTAPLPGHIDSVKSFNVAPAAGYHDHHSAPAHYADHYAHAPVAHHDHHHDSHYVAKTLGAVHTAPLPGHVDSVKSFNVAPAPGTHH